MIILKSERDLELMRPACAVAGKVLDEISAFIKPGLTTRQVCDKKALDFLASQSILFG